MHKNIAVYEPSGTRPCRHAATGEYPIGISYELAGMMEKDKGAPIDILVMKEGRRLGHGYRRDPQGHEEPCRRKGPDGFAASRKANELYAKWVPLTAIEGVAPPPKNYPAGVAASMIKNDFAWAMENRDRILAEWQKRFAKR